MSASTDQQFVAQVYDKEWWPHADRVLQLVTEYAGKPECEKDLIGFDCLNGGPDEVFAVGELLQPGPQDRLLDIGCGLGGPARMLAEKYGCQVEGLDLSTEQIEAARVLTKHVGLENQVQFHLLPIEQMKGYDSCFSHAYAIESLVHVAQKQSVLEGIMRCLQPGGKLVIADYIRHAPAPGIERLFPEGYHPWEPEELESRLRATGFVNVKLYDRSVTLGHSYLEFYRLFGNEKLSYKDFLGLFAWWLEGSNTLSKKVQRILGALRFLKNRKGVSSAFLGPGYDNILQFCKEQGEACLSGTVQYVLAVAEKPVRS